MISEFKNNFYLCLDLCKSLKSIETIDQLFILQRILSNKYNSKRTSYLGNFVSLCSSKVDLSTFDDRLMLLQNLKLFIKKSKWVIKYSTEIGNNKYDFISNLEADYKKIIGNDNYLNISNGGNYYDINSDNDPMIDTFKTFIDKTRSIEASNQICNNIILSDTHLQNIINYRIESVVQRRDPNEFYQHNYVDQCLDNMSLNEITMFQSIYIL